MAEDEKGSEFHGEKSGWGITTGPRKGEPTSSRPICVLPRNLQRLIPVTLARGKQSASAGAATGFDLMQLAVVYYL